MRCQTETIIITTQSQAGAMLPDADEIKAMQTELVRLRRENRALGIAVSELERVAQRDMLTPLFNRRYFLTALHQRIARVQRYHESIAVIYVDVDGLKTINDRLGHAAGDFALVEIARRLSENVREADVAARIGGDEFGILIDHVDHESARRKVAVLCHALSQAPCIYGEHSINVSAAFGLTMIGEGDNAEELLGRADQDMYRVKRMSA